MNSEWAGAPAGRGAPGARRGAEGRRAPDRGGGPVRRLRDRGPGRLAGRARPGAGLPGRPGRGRDRARATSAAAPARCVQVVTDHPVAGLPGQPVRRLGDQRGEVLRDGLRPDARRGRQASRSSTKIGCREEAECGGRRARGAQDADARGRRQDRRGLPGRPVGGDACWWRRRRASRAGVQVVARSVETALHKLAELGFDLARIVSAHGSAPLAAGRRERPGRDRPDQRRDPLRRPRRPLRRRATTTASRRSARKVPSSASRDHGEPFAAIFARYNHDFYAVDPHLFSPAEVVFQNLETGRRPRLRRRSSPTSWSARSSSTDRPDRPCPPTEHDSSPSSPASAGTSRTCAGRPGRWASTSTRSRSRASSGASGRGPSGSRRAGSTSRGVDGVLVRMMPPGSLEQVVFRMDALHRLEALGVPVLNPPRAVEASVDKYLVAGPARAPRACRCPPTWAGESADEALAAFEALGGDVVVKPLFGSEGRGLVRVSDRELRPADVPDARTARGRALRPAGTSGTPATTSASSCWATASWGRSAGTRRRATGGRTSPSAAVPSRAALDPDGRAAGPRRGRGRRGRDGGGRPPARPRPRRAWSSSRSTPSPAGAPWPGRPASTSPPRSSLTCWDAADDDRRIDRSPGPARPDRLPARSRRRGSRGTSTAFRDFDDAHFLDFLLSAAAIAGPLDRAPADRRRAAPCSRRSRRRARVVATNTNLGMILAARPAGRRARGRHARATGSRRSSQRPRSTTPGASTEAIRLARPGGLGTRARAGRRGRADRDPPARRCAWPPTATSWPGSTPTAIADVFDRALPRLARLAARRAGRSRRRSSARYLTSPGRASPTP